MTSAIKYHLRWAAMAPLIFLANIAWANKYSYDLGKYNSNCSITAQVRLDGEAIDCELAVFAVDDDECRGSIMSNASKNCYLSAQGSKPVELYFRAIFNIDGMEYDVKVVPKEACIFRVNANYGSINAPYYLDLESFDITPTQGYQTFFDSEQSYLLPIGLNGYTYSIAYTADGTALTCNKSYDSVSSFNPSGMEVKGVVLPKETAAVLYTKTGAERITIVSTCDEGNQPTTKSSLFGTDDDTVITAAEGEKHYILGVGSKGLGFYIAYDPTAEKRSFTNKAHKAYLYLDAQQAKMAPAMISLGIDEDGEADGIAAVLCDDTPAASSQPVNLLGIPVSDDYQGIVIINGKKVLKR